MLKALSMVMKSREPLKSASSRPSAKSQPVLLRKLANTASTIAPPVWPGSAVLRLLASEVSASGES